MKHSAGLLVYKQSKAGYVVLLAHPGGPFWGNKDKWVIPKGVVEESEEYIAAARREFKEEIGVPAPEGELFDLGFIKESSKTNYIWAIEGDVDLTKFSSNTFTMEWPPHSGKEADFPENDRAAWFDLASAKQKLFKGQIGFIDRLAEHLGVSTEPPETDSAQLSLL